MGILPSVKRQYTLLMAAAIVLIALPHFVGPYWQHLLIYVIWFIYLCVAWHIACSTGMYSFCHTLYIGGGGYTSTLLFRHFGLSPWLGMVAGAGVALLLALALGLLCFPRRMPPLSYCVITLALAFAGIAVVYGFPVFLGGDEGFSLAFTSSNLWNYQFLSKLPYYYIILAMAIGVVAIQWIIVRSRMGLYFRAISNNERAAAAVGVNVVRYKLISLGLSAIICAVGGTFWVQYSAFVNPASIMDIRISILLFLFTVVGGLGTIWGPVLAVSILLPLGEILRAWGGTYVAGMDSIVYGTIIILIIIYMPQGIWPWLTQRLARKREVAVQQKANGLAKF